MSNTELSHPPGRTFPDIRFRHLGISAIVLIAVGLTTHALSGNHPLSFEDRVRYQHRIEQVYWQHRTWPAENPGPKPTLDQVLPDAMLRQRVATYLGKSAAQEIVWSRPLTGHQLQAEIHRMVRNTKDPDLLRELFAALDDDPYVVAECLARPVLAERLTRNWYARDARFHGALLERAEAALATYTDSGVWPDESGGDHALTEWRLRSNGSESVERDTNQVTVELSRDEWQARIVRLASLFGVEREDDGVRLPDARLERIPLERYSALVEEDDRFVVTAVLSKDHARLRTATVTWNKRPFGTWWSERGRAAVAAAGATKPVRPPEFGYELTSPLGSGCTADTWEAVWSVPKRRSSHAAVWTGAEMIVWGGYDGAQRLSSGGRYDPATDTWTRVSEGPGRPLERWGHTAVWTGTEMIVWGGYGEDPVDTGGRYDPLTDSWTATSTDAAAMPRYAHTAVWTGTEMIVWGGWDGEHYNSGGRYDPATDGWAPTSVGTGVPLGRSHHTAVWTGTEMIVWGGLHDFQNFHWLNTGGRYDPASDSWRPTTTSYSPASRERHTAVWTGTEMIIWGGEVTIPVFDEWGNVIFWDPAYFNSGGRYDPVTDSWTATPSSGASGAPDWRTNHVAVWTGLEMIVWGGSGYAGSYSSTGGRYDPATDRWAATSSGAGVPTGRTGHSAIWSGSEMIVWGGRREAPPLYLVYENDGGRYDPTTDSWTPTSTGVGVPSERESHSAVWTGAEMIVWGGTAYETSFVNTGGRYDLATDSWAETSTGAGVPEERYGHTTVWTGTEMIVWGGIHRNYPRQINTGGRYDPGTDSWTATATGTGVPIGRDSHTAVWTGSEMIVWGGYRSDGEYHRFNDGGRYDPDSNGWTPTSTGDGVPAGRGGHEAVWTGTEMIVWGGSDGSGSLETGGRYDPGADSWSATSTDSSVPTESFYETAVWTGSEMIVWGPTLDASLGARYDPRTDRWSAISTAPVELDEIRGHLAIWTGTEMIVWGGYRSESGNPRVNDGARYDPASDSWAPTSKEDGVPEPRRYATAVWTGAEMIVWGGHTTGTQNYGHAKDGGRYCACAGGTVSTWYPDADGDDVGVDSTGIPSCAQPPGYVAVGGDCDDTNLDTHPGAAEVNDGLDNQCPGDGGHGLVDEITGVCGFHDPDDEHELSWPAQSGATRYEIARSTDPQFAADCLAIETTEAYWSDTEPVSDGVCYRYLVRALQPYTGSWGVDSSGVERTAVCP